MARQDTEAMLWFGGRWWWFPGAQIGTESEFEWRGGKGFLLDPNGKTVVNRRDGLTFSGIGCADTDVY
jgi:hypothetical protein